MFSSPMGNQDKENSMPNSSGSPQGAFGMGGMGGMNGMASPARSPIAKYAAGAQYGPTSTSDNNTNLLKVYMNNQLELSEEEMQDYETAINEFSSKLEEAQATVKEQALAIEAFEAKDSQREIEVEEWRQKYESVLSEQASFKESITKEGNTSLELKLEEQRLLCESLRTSLDETMRLVQEKDAEMSVAQAKIETLSDSLSGLSGPNSGHTDDSSQVDVDPKVVAGATHGWNVVKEIAGVPPEGRHISGLSEKKEVEVEGGDGDREEQDRINTTTPVRTNPPPSSAINQGGEFTPQSLIKVIMNNQLELNEEEMQGYEDMVNELADKLDEAAKDREHLRLDVDRLQTGEGGINDLLEQVKQLHVDNQAKEQQIRMQVSLEEFRGVRGGYCSILLIS